MKRNIDKFHNKPQYFYTNCLPASCTITRKSDDAGNKENSFVHLIEVCFGFIHVSLLLYLRHEFNPDYTQQLSCCKIRWCDDKSHVLTNRNKKFEKIRKE